MTEPEVVNHPIPYHGADVFHHPEKMPDGSLQTLKCLFCDRIIAEAYFTEGARMIEHPNSQDGDEVKVWCCYPCWEEGAKNGSRNA